MYHQNSLFRGVAICLLLLGLTSFIQAQLLNHVQGRVLVQLEELPANQSIRSWISAQKDEAGKSLELEYGHQISRHANIYLINFNHDAVDENLVLTQLRSNNQVINAQFDHFVKTRETTPNDPEFLNQWQYINTGQSGGVVGADIDIDLAWDYTTGGITAAGDTIVACVIDDGIDFDHPDMAPNLWVNHAEIPDNGIDDDNNGYVDDYRGWDTGNNNDAVYDGGGHGTPVAGIVGARGNDGFGVAGVNWNVKLMIVQGGTGVESEVLEAYGYPLDARIRYNETDGAEGAFVVTTNASWGIDFGDPADAPLWCAFYDTLGVHGILNCGATINNDVDVDANGDLPTACPSEYLIAVTNMGDDDNKVQFAGYGTETIDLGAFGQGTWTVASGGGFGGFGGTSGATPHVAGTVALLYGLPCPDLINIAKSDPGAAALIMKQAIFDGVDQNESLQGITTTGGRLNVHNAVLNVLSQCGGCLPPLSPLAVVETDSQAVITYTLLNDTTVNQIDLRYRIVDTEDWIVLTDVMSPVTLNNLTGCSDYEFQLQSFCDTTMSDFSRSYLFSTLGCCENPEEFTAVVQDSFSVAFAWSEPFGVQTYELETRVAGTADWTVTSTTETSALIDELAACTTLEYRFRVICSDTTSSDYTAIQSVTTVGCGACVDQTYCVTPEISTEEEWISNVTIGDIDNNSGGGESGYTDFTGGQTTTFVAGSEYGFSLSPGYAGTAYSEGWAVFIDYDQDGSFGGPGEMVWESGNVSNTTVTGTFVVPFMATDGYTRMRIGMVFNTTPNACNTNSEFGEYEDYCVTIEAIDLEPCVAPISLEQVDMNPGNDSTLTFSWDGTGEDNEYLLRFRKENVISWTEMQVAATEMVITDLDSCSNYEVQVRSVCTFDRFSDYSESAFAQTACISSVRFPELGLENWSIAPNPTSGAVNVSYSFASTPASIAVRLFSQYGREVSYQQVGAASQGNVALDIKGLPAGVYYLRLETEAGNSRVRKVVKL